VLVDAPAPEAPFADCPPFDFLLPIAAPIDSYLGRVLALPDGDVVVGGYHSGGEQFGRGDGDQLAWESGGFVARLSPDGRLRWSRDVSGGVDDLVLVGSSVWVTGGYYGRLEIEGVSYPELTTEGFGSYAVRFDGGGAVERVVGMGGVLGRSSVAQDPAGNVYLASGLREPYLTVGDLQISRYDLEEQNDEDAWVGSFDATGRLRWLTSVGGPIWSDTAGLFWVGDGLQWVVSHRNDPGALTATYGTSAGVRVPVPVTSRGTSLLRVDAGTGLVADVQEFAFTNQLFVYSAEWSEGRVHLFGTAATPTSWVDATGVSRELWGPPEGGANGLHIALAPSGAPAQVNAPIGGAGAWAGATGGPQLAIAGTQQFTREFGAGTDRAVTFGSGVLESDGWFGLFDERDQFRCGWEVKGKKTQYLTDVTWAADGGLWLVGWSEAPYTLVDPVGRELARSDRVNTEGFAIRFHPPGE
jgi:hypothetical protein